VQPLPHRTESHQQARGHKRRRAGLDGLHRQSSRHHQRHKRRGDEARDKGEPAGELIVFVRRQQPRGDAADTGDPAGQRHQHDGRHADQRAADEGGNRCERCCCHSVALPFDSPPIVLAASTVHRPRRTFSAARAEHCVAMINNELRFERRTIATDAAKRGGYGPKRLPLRPFAGIMIPSTGHARRLRLTFSQARYFY